MPTMWIRWMATCMATLLAVAATARADDYVVGGDSEVEFLAKITASSFTARSEHVSGKVSHDQATSALSGGELRVKADSFETGMAMRDAHTRDKYLEAAKFPAIKLVITGGAVAAKAGARGTLEGKFVIKGKERAVKLPVTVKQAAGGKLVVVSKFKLDVRDYGIAQPSFAVVKMEPVIDVTVNLVLKRST
jgi:polyisoprenoid-binding protein YceI